jgi:hypothetical protein
MAPVQIGGSDAGLKEYSGAARTFFKQIESIAAVSLNVATGTGIAFPIRMGAKPLIEEPNKEKRSKQKNKYKNYDHEHILNLRTAE